MGDIEMNIGIIGSGNIGATTARLFAKAGQQVALSNSRGPASLTSIVEEIGAGVKATTTEETASFGEVVLIAIPLKAYTSLSADLLNGKIVIDAMNYYPQRDGEMAVDKLSSSELVAQQLPGSQVVKAFNTLYFETIAKEGKATTPAESRLAILIAGDSPEAKATVAGLIDEIGFTAVDTGNLKEGSRRQEQGTELYGKSLTAAEARAQLAAK